MSATRDPGHRRAATSPATQRGGRGERHQGRARRAPEVGALGAEVAVLGWSQAVPGGAGVLGGGSRATMTEGFPWEQPRAQLTPRGAGRTGGPSPGPSVSCTSSPPNSVCFPYRETAQVRPGTKLRPLPSVGAL